MRGRGLALMAGVAVGRHAASQQAAAQQQQQAQAQPMQAAPAAPAHRSDTPQGCHRRAAKTGRSSQIGCADR